MERFLHVVSISCLTNLLIVCIVSPIDPQIVEKVALKTPVKIDENVVEQTPVNIAEIVVEQTPVETAENVVEQAPVDIAEIVVEQTLVETAENVVEQAPVDTAERSGPETPVENVESGSGYGEMSNKDVSIGCANGWTPYNSGQKCFWVGWEKMSFMLASSYCGHDDGELAVIDDAETNKFLSDILDEETSYWIGVLSVVKEQYYKWKTSSESLTTYTNWAVTEPAGLHKCVKMQLNQNGIYRWYTESCQSLLPYVCEKYLSSSTPACRDDTWVKFSAGNVCFKYFANPLPYHNANFSCVQANADLATVKERTTHDFIQETASFGLTKNEKFWIGLGESDPYTDTWQVWFPSGQEVHYKNFVAGSKASEPEEGSCVLYKGQHWIANGCQTQHSYVCQTEPNKITTTSCPEGYAIYASANYHTCFGIEDKDKLDFFEAKKSCEEGDGFLAKIPDAATNNFIRGLLMTYQDYWIGLYRSDLAKGFSWLQQDEDGSESSSSSTEQLDFSYWDQRLAAPFPDNCVTFSKNTDDGKYYWNVKNCQNSRLPFICQTAPNVDVEYLNRKNGVQTTTVLNVITQTAIQLVKSTITTDCSTTEMAATTISPSSTAPPTTDLQPSSTTVVLDTGQQDEKNTLYTTCFCHHNLTYDPAPSKEALALVTKEIEKSLIVNVLNLSSTRNRKESAKDYRPSSTTMGYLAVIIFLIPISLMVLSDITHLVGSAETHESGWSSD